MKLTFLGTGTSHGVPYIGCECEVCTSSAPKNKRLRPSILLEDDAASTRLLVDTGPDFRQQLLRENIGWISAVLWTHTHNDHVIGLDDLRHLTDRCGYLNTYASTNVLAHLEMLFGYAFVGGREHPGFPRLIGNSIAPRETFQIADFRITPIPIFHGRHEIFAYRFEQGAKGNQSTLVYATDCSAIPDESRELMQNADVLILDALRHRPHPNHFSIAQALEAVQMLQPRRAFFTHIAHDLDHDSTNATLPDGVELAYDGLRLEL
jgi:phosphoribosyl 1,2-cyclic phosphate phosphodiesterase